MGRQRSQALSLYQWWWFIQRVLCIWNRCSERFVLDGTELCRPQSSLCAAGHRQHKRNLAFFRSWNYVGRNESAAKFALDFIHALGYKSAGDVDFVLRWQQCQQSIPHARCGRELGQSFHLNTEWFEPLGHRPSIWHRRRSLSGDAAWRSVLPQQQYERLAELQQRTSSGYRASPHRAFLARQRVTLGYLEPRSMGGACI